jgi:hypothetical protein
MRPYSWMALVLAGVGTATFCLGEPPEKPEVAPARCEIAGYSLPGAKYVGAASCAAASCHGGTVGEKSGEYVTWAGQDAAGRHARDPHSRAFRVLYNEVSQRIARNLGPTPDKFIPAYENSLCLKCHAPMEACPSSGPPKAIQREALKDFGVGCESCHGPAEHYLAEHYLTGFQGLSDKEKAEQFGLYPTKDLAFRVQLCASCHVGDETREVNHDLIAAGHPRLMFEYVSYQHHPQYQLHWVDKAYGNESEVRAWAFGRVAMARAAVALLRSRAERDEKSSSPRPWPEFTEYGCYACHKDLSPDRKYWTSSEFNVPKRALGLLPWGTWALPALDALKALPDDLGAGAGPALTELEKLRKLMESPAPDRQAVKVECDNALSKLDAWLKALRPSSDSRPLRPEEIAALSRKLAENTLKCDESNKNCKLNDIDWDGAAQHYLGMTAIAEATRKTQPGQKVLLEKLRSNLLFSDSYNSPRTSDPKVILELFISLRDLTQDGKPKP